MALFEKARYEGEIEIGPVKLPIGFDAEIDDTGALNITLDQMPVTKATLGIGSLSKGLGRKFRPAKLSGTSSAGTKLYSESFIVTGHLNHTTSDGDGDYVHYSGHCSRAEIRFDRTGEDRTHGLVWWFRRLETFRGINETIDLGVVGIAGAARDKEHPQRLTGTIGIKAETDDEDWIERALERIDHITRVMSVACGLYLQPYVQQRYTTTEQILTVTRYGQAHEPSLGAFHYLHYDDIFKTACQSTSETCVKLKRLDNAIQWVLTPAYYTEIRLIGAMTAIEAILETVFSEDEKLFLKKLAFEKVAKAVRTVLREMNIADATTKVGELNRRNLQEKLQRYLVQCGINVSDLPADSVKRITKARNHVVHRGVYHADESQERGSLFDCALLAREIVIRILLDVIGFEGKYIAIYFGNDLKEFP
jgi:hypothetical protein